MSIDRLATYARLHSNNGKASFCGHRILQQLSKFREISDNKAREGLIKSTFLA